MNSRKFGERVAMLRKARNMTQAQLAEQLNVSNKTISRWETGDGYPEITLLMPLAKALGVTVDQLLEYEEKNDSEDRVNPQKSAENNYSRFSAKEYKHSDRPVEWPSLIFKTNKRKMCYQIINVLFFLITAIVYYNAADINKFSVVEWSFGQSTYDGSGYFCDAWLGYVLITVALIMFAGVLFYNIKAKTNNISSGVQLAKNIVIATGFTFFILLNFTYITGKRTFNSISGTTTDWINCYNEGTFFNCNFFKFDFKIIMLTLLISVGLYLLGEIIIHIIRRKKQEESSGNSDILRAFWRSLTVFNKIAVLCLILDIICIFIILLLMIDSRSLMAVPVMIMIPSFISRAGLFAGLIGLILGFIDITDRQNKASIIFIIINFAAIYVFPVIMMLFSMGGLAIGSGITNVFENVMSIDGTLFF